MFAANWTSRRAPLPLKPTEALPRHTRCAEGLEAWLLTRGTAAHYVLVSAMRLLSLLTKAHEAQL
jgi:hypothetical protein